jgi:hypothetical protein
MGEMRNEQRILVGKFKGRRPYLRCWRNCENGFKMDFKALAGEEAQ